MNTNMQTLKVSGNGRFIVQEDGTPFFWLGDTAWHLFHRLTREEVDLYLLNRVERKFNVIQAIALAECDGLRTKNRYGRQPLLKNADGKYDPSMPDLGGDYSYWDHVDYVINRAYEWGMYIGFLPAWGDKFNIMWGKGPEIFTPINARKYGQWLGERYKSKPNLIWILGGDRPLQNEHHDHVIRGMAEGLFEAHQGKQLMTFHPPGNKSSVAFVHHEKWLSFHMIQSGHNHKEVCNYHLVNEGYQATPTRPVMESEPCYEEHTLSSDIKDGFYTDYEVRRAAYWGLFAGGFGHTYGHHAVWSMTTEPTERVRVDWKEGIESHGSAQMQFVRKLLESQPMLERIPDQSLVVESYQELEHVRCTRGKGYAFIYIPTGNEIVVKMGLITGEEITAYWYDPRDGSYAIIDHYDNEGLVTFTPPSQGTTNDWILVLEDSAKDSR